MTFSENVRCKAKGEGITKPLRCTVAATLFTLAAALTTSAFAADSDLGDSGAAPDYAEDANWALRGLVSGPQATDVFYIHPTTYIAQQFNQRMDYTPAREWTRASVADRQVSAFSACCRLFMPFYRQASTRAFKERDGRGALAYDLAYADVEGAFRAWEAQSDGRPFIVAGHSQGALHGLRLLKTAIAGTPLADRLVAAYLPGIGIPIGALPADIGPCLTPKQTRCIASWNAFTPQADVSAWAKRSVDDYAVAGRDTSLLCTNPITFDANRPSARAAQGKGMLPIAVQNQPHARKVAKPADAYCHDGVLRVTPRAHAPATSLPNGSLHMQEIALFWGDISANAALRARNWRKEHAR